MRVHNLFACLLLIVGLIGCVSAPYTINDAYVDVAAAATAVGNAAAEGRITADQQDEYLDQIQDIKNALDIAATIADAETRADAVRRAVSIGRSELLEILTELEERAHEPE